MEPDTILHSYVEVDSFEIDILIYIYNIYNIYNNKYYNIYTLSRNKIIQVFMRQNYKLKKLKIMSIKGLLNKCFFFLKDVNNCQKNL